MNTGVKAILYAVLVIATAITGYFFFQSFGKLFEEEKPKTTATAPANPVPNGGDTNAVPDTNTVPVTVVMDTNAPPTTNTMAAASSTNAAPETNVVAATKEPPSEKAKKTKSKRAAAASGTGV